MKPTAIRNATYADRLAAFPPLRRIVMDCLAAQAAPVSTRQIAALTGLDIISVRPRVTELYQQGFAECTGRGEDGGLYKAVPPEQVCRKLMEQDEAQIRQPTLPIL